MDTVTLTVERQHYDAIVKALELAVGCANSSADIMASHAPASAAQHRGYAATFNAALAAVGKNAVAAEARRLTEAGWAPDAEDEHARGSLALAAACYAQHAAGMHREFAPDQRAPLGWPFGASQWQPGASHQESLVKAAALLSLALGSTTVSH